MATNFVARNGDKLAHPPLLLLFVLAFYNKWECHNADCCINIDDDFFTYVKNSVNFGPVTREISWFICMSGVM